MFGDFNKICKIKIIIVQNVNNSIFIYVDYVGLKL